MAASGKMEARASQLASVSDVGAGFVAAVDAAVGFSVAVTVAVHTTRATSGRNLAAGGAVTSRRWALERLVDGGGLGGRRGGGGRRVAHGRGRLGRTADEDVADQRDLASGQSAALGAGTQSRVDSAPDSPAAESSEQDSSGDSTPLQVAAAIAVTVAVSDQDASLPAGIVVGSSSAGVGVVTLGARGNSDIGGVGGGSGGDHGCRDR